MTDDTASTPPAATVVHGAASDLEAAAVHAAISRHVEAHGGPLTDLARWRRRRLAALARIPDSSTAESAQCR
jgi:hypothetical protein